MELAKNYSGDPHEHDGDSAIIYGDGELRKIYDAKANSDPGCTRGVTMPERKLEWQTVAMIEIGEVIGGGILTMGCAFAQLGWVLATFFLVLFLIVNVYIGLVVSRVSEIFPTALSFKEMAQLTGLHKAAVKLISLSVQTYMIFCMSGYLLAASEALSMVFFDVELCGPLWGTITLGLVAFPIQVRSLHGARWLVWANFAFVVIAVFASCIYMIRNIDIHHASTLTSTATAIFPEDLTWISFFNGISKLLFAYLGCYLYLQMLAEMRKPSDFPKTFLIAGPFQVGMYMFVGTVGYIYDGVSAKSIILDSINPHTHGATLRAAAIFLALHLIVTYVILSTVLVRRIHVYADDASVNDRGKRGRVVWLALSLSLLLLCFILANAIPLFDKITSLAGALQAPIIGFIAPCLFLLFAHRRAGIRTSKLEMFVLFTVILCSTIILFVGTAANIISFIDAMNEQKKTPFECVMASYIDNWSS
uniref:Amino acid transporter transmembrane domain-containing protein n=1 Tax=Mucochytrium quahogii TaxID=96639 RepID=A0A7S2RWY1_9STRA|mmetsp:Transcript_3563/g.6841  ORF Transcript_3563/g.6841 Transcript_3563/m.6841 type:complete len:476 (+) Transcript_3563:721-2148(+)